MKILVLAGGTLGHINPALIYCQELKKKYPDIKIYFISTLKDQKYFKTQNTYIYKHIYLNAFGMSKNIKKWFINYKCFKDIKKLIKNENIKVVFGFGGYISGIGLLAGKTCKCKTYLHEQNSIMGKANRYIAKYVDLVFLAYPLLNNKLTNTKITGTPVYLKAKQIKKHIYKQKNKILFTSGTLGSYTINNLAVQFVENDISKNYQVIIVTGSTYYLDIRKKLKDYKHVQVIEFTNNLVELIAESEIIISRAGASTLFEIMGCQSVSVIIPSPNVTENHQFYNAKYFADLNCATLILESNLNIETFLNTFNKVIKNYQEYSSNILNLNLNSSCVEMIKESTNGIRD